MAVSGAVAVSCVVVASGVLGVLGLGLAAVSLGLFVSALVESLPAAAAGDIASPLAATVVKVEVAVGQQVTAGQELAVLEAMKMNNSVHAPREGTVSAIHVAAGDVVAEGQPLLTLA